MRKPHRISRRIGAARSERKARIDATYGSLDKASACVGRPPAIEGLLGTVRASSHATTEHADITKNGKADVDEPASRRSAVAPRRRAFVKEPCVDNQRRIRSGIDFYFT
jgi:hypothetical protein